MNRKDENKIRAGRREIANKAKKARAKSELDRVRNSPARDINSPHGFGPIWEALSGQRHITRDPGDQSAPDQQQHRNPFTKSPFEP
jgi:hypothetical protein